MRETIAAILTAIIGLAVVAVLVSRNANTSGVLQAGGNAFSQLIIAATGPVSGNYGNANTSGGAASPMIGTLLGASSGNFTGA